MKCNDAGRTIILSEEGDKLRAYLDTRGIWTIGEGHTGPEVVPGLTWTQDQVDQQFETDLAQRAENPVTHYVTVDLNENQFSALCSLCFNIGSGEFKNSHLCAVLNAGNYDSVQSEMMRWDHNHDGTVNAGLQTRREKEVALWLA